MADKGLSESEKKLDIKISIVALNPNNPNTRTYLKNYINELIKTAKLQTFEDVWKIFCKRCEYTMQYPSGKECYNKAYERIANNETAYVDASVENCPLIKNLRRLYERNGEV